MLKPNFITEQVESSHSYGKFVISPLPAGFGHTFGNALRRVLLSSISSYATTYVKINNIVHPFSTIKGVKDSVLDIILNIKLLKFKAVGEGPFEINFSVSGKKKIFGGDFKGGSIEVVNKEQYVTEIVDEKTKLELSLIVEKGLGYSPSEEKERKEFGFIPLDSLFSPVTKVNYFVERTRVGRVTNFDKLTLEIWTDKSISPEDSLRQAKAILGEYFNYILTEKDTKQTSQKPVASRVDLPKEVDKKVYQTIIDELDLPTRVVNALLREKVETVEDLLKMGKENITNFKGVGKKSIDLIQKELKKLGISFY